MPLEICLAYDEIGEVKSLVMEYMNMLLRSDPIAEKCLKEQEYLSELEQLHEKYALPSGRLYIARWNGMVAGCIGLRFMAEDVCEMKRLYVKPDFRGKRIAHCLIEKIVEDAREIGYQSMLLDTLPFLTNAIRLYQAFGFYNIPAYNGNPVEDAVFMRLDL